MKTDIRYLNSKAVDTVLKTEKSPKSNGKKQQSDFKRVLDATFRELCLL